MRQVALPTMLSLLLKSPIAFHRVLVDLTGGDVNAALILSQALYWQERCEREDGFWRKSQEEWTREIGLSRKEMDRAKAKLCHLQLISTERRGAPARLWFRLNELKLSECLESVAGDNKAKVVKLFNRPIAYHRDLVFIAGRPTAAVFLCQAIYWTGTLDEARAGWFWKLTAEWEEETGLSRRELETARRDLRKAGILEDRRERMPNRVWYRLNLDVLGELLERLRKTRGEDSKKPKVFPVCPISPSVKSAKNQNSTGTEKAQSFPSMADSAVQHGAIRRPDCPDPPLLSTESSSENRALKETASETGGGAHDGNGQAHASGTRLTVKEAFGLECPAWVGKGLGESRVCKVMLRYGLGPESARRVLCELAAAKIRSDIDDEGAYLNSLCASAAKSELGASAGGEEMLGDIHF